MKIRIKSIDTNKFYTFNNKEELREFTCKFIEEIGEFDSLRAKVYNNNQATVYDMLQVLSGSYERVNLNEKENKKVNSQIIFL